MNRSIVSVLLGGFGGDSDEAAAAASSPKGNVKRGSADDASFIMGNAQKVIIVPGYGMAVSQVKLGLPELLTTLLCLAFLYSYLSTMAKLGHQTYQ